MKKYAQIVNNKVHGIFDYKVLPEFHTSIVMIDITNLTTLPKSGDMYDGTNFISPTPPTLEENKLAKIKDLQDKFQLGYDTYLSQYPQSEIATFNDKKREALAYNIDPTVPTPIIDAIVANMPSTTKASYIAGVMAKITYLAGQEGTMVEIRDNIKACTTQAELDLIII